MTTASAGRDRLRIKTAFKANNPYELVLKQERDLYTTLFELFDEYVNRLNDNKLASFEKEHGFGSINNVNNEFVKNYKLNKDQRRNAQVLYERMGLVPSTNALEQLVNVMAIGLFTDSADWYFEAYDYE